jgi:hypothetical protein
MDLLAEKRYGMTFDWVTLLEPDLIARCRCCTGTQCERVTRCAAFGSSRHITDHLESRYQLSAGKFMPETEAAVEELMSSTADM